MHVQTGAMAEFETDEDAKAAGYTPIRDIIKKQPAMGPTKLSSLITDLYGMNRHDRRAWASQQRKSK